MKDIAVGTLYQRLRTIFPDREFIMRSQGQVRFIKISTRFQVLAGSAAALALAIWLLSLIVMAVLGYTAEQDRLSLIDREAKVATAESRVSHYRDGIDSVAEDLARRQKFIESMVEAHVGPLPDDITPNETVTNSADEAQKTAEKISAAFPEAADLARIEAQQLVFVEQLTRFADRRSVKVAKAIRKLGLNPESLLAAARSRSAVGGPFQKLSTARDGSLDPRFRRLGVSLERMEALESSLAGIPQVEPANLNYVSSSFGYRTDPINGGAAFHAGLDFRGPIGTPIYAAAKGRVVYAGPRAGYGNCVEIDHGNGLTTRYAHMSRIKTKLQQKVGAGDTIGAIGSTGRSTGPHLHFEVRVHGRPVNPRPFLEYARNVQQETEQGT